MTTAEHAAPLDVVVDGWSLARPTAGTARWVKGVTRALREQPGVQATLAEGPGLIRRGGPLHRIPNLLRERWWYEVALGRIARRRHADALLMPSSLTARRTRLPQVVTILDVNFLTVTGTYDPSYVRYATWAYRRAVRDADAITTISDFSRQEIARHLDVEPGRIQVIYPGLDPAPSTPVGPIERAPYALFVGATERHKNVGMLLEAWRHRSPAGLRLVIVGRPGNDHAALLATASRMADRVRVVGGVDESSLERWYRHASVFVIASRTEGFGYPPLEAMQRGVPVVAAAAGSLPEILGDGALYFDPDDGDALVAHIETLAADPRLRDQMRSRAMAVIRRYRWPHTGAAMADALRRVVAG